MNSEVPYMLSVTNLPKILDAMQQASAPDTFHLDFLRDLGFKASTDRGAVKLLKYLGLIDQSGKPQASYREFMDHSKARKVLAARIRTAFDDLFTSNKEAHLKSVDTLKGWFKTKTGAGDAVAQKMATTFKSLAQYADFDGTISESTPIQSQPDELRNGEQATSHENTTRGSGGKGSFGLVYRFEIHLPDTQNVDTFRAIFRALREELL